MGLLFGLGHLGLKSGGLSYGGLGSFSTAHWALSFKPAALSPSFFSLSSFRFGANNLYCYRPPVANSAPVTTPVTLASIFEDRPSYIITQAQLLARASDANGDFLRASNLRIAQGNGSLVNNGNGTWTYVPATNDDTAVQFIYQISDGKISTTGRANLDLVAVNDAPTTSLVAMPTVLEDSGSYVITSAQLLAQATDVDSQVLQVLNFSIASGQGSLVNNGNGNWTFTPAANNFGVVQFNYQISDGSASTMGTAYINITNVNDAPIVSGPVSLISVPENTNAVIITQNDLLANASDIDSNLQAINLTIAAGQGSLIDNGNGTWSYIPALNDDTNVSFNFQITDGQVVVASNATLDLTSTNSTPTNSGSINLVLLEDNSILITQNDLLANASDADGDSLQAINLTINSGSGNLIDNGNGTWSFTPLVNDDSQVVFGYNIVDGNGGSVAGTVNLDISPVNDPPASSPVSLAAIAEDSGIRIITQAELLANASDVEGNPLIASNLTIATGNGSLADNGNGTWTYIPAPNDSQQVLFNYTITDSLGATVAVTTTLAITPVNDAPTTSPVTLAPIQEDSGPRTINQSELLANAFDIDGGALTVSNLVINAGLGSLVNNGPGSWTYTPEANDDTQLSFTYTISDGNGGSVSGTATLDIIPVNDAPTTSPVTLVAIAEDSGVRVITQAELLVNAVDIESLNLTASNLSLASGNGSLVSNGNGTWNYSPAANDGTQVVFNYTITDDLGSTVAGVANLDITPVSDAPLVSLPTVLTASPEDSVRTITQAELLVNASDVDGDSLQAINLTINSGLGTLVDNGDGSWTYFPAANDNSSVSFNYNVTDGQLTTATTASLDITPVNDSPQVLPNSIVLAAMTSGIPRIITEGELLLNATDIDGDTLHVNSVVIATGAGSLIDNGNGTWSYFSAMGDTSQVSFNYNVSDGQINVASQASLDIIGPISLAVQSQMLITSLINGGGIFEQLGSSVSNAGDANGDGLDDFVMSTTDNDEGGVNAGAAYVIYGQSNVISLPDIAISSLGTAGYKIIGDQAGDEAGTDVGFAGDFNGDGLDDFLIAAPLNDAGGQNTGVVYVVYGQTGISDPTDIDLSTLGTRGTRIIGDLVNDELGFNNVSYVGDINGDGLDDIIVSALAANFSGKAYVIFGQSNTADVTDIDLSSLGTKGFQIFPESLDRLGFQQGVAAAGDFNGDGLDDFIVGAPDNDANGRTDAGAAYVIYGQSSPSVFADVDLSTLGSRGFKISGSTAGESIGYSVAGIGDVNGDGRDDIAIGLNTSFGTGIGKIYVIYGHEGGFASLDLATMTTEGFVITGAINGDLVGLELSSAGDFNGDGINDFIISAENTSISPLLVQGGAYVIYGQSQGGDIPDINLAALGTNGFRILGSITSESIGTSISKAGDLNGDGLDDLVIGAIGAKTGSITTGAANILYGVQQKLSGDYVVGTDTVKLMITVSNNTNYVEVRVPTGFSVVNGTFNGGTGLWTVLASAFPEITIQGNITGDFSVGVQAFEDATNFSTKQAFSYNFSTTTGVNDINVALPLGNLGTVVVGALNGSAGRAVSYVGDINGDGLDDIAVGDNDNDLGGVNAGAVYVIYGQHIKDLADINLASLGTRGFVITGEDIGDSAGVKIAAAGDVNGDGLDDFVFSATLNDAGASNAGAAYIIYGQSGGGDPLDIDLSTLGARGSKILGENNSDFLGFSVAGNIDVNGDGFDDIILSSPNNNGGRGAAYVIYGSNTVNDIPDIDLSSLTTLGTKFSGAIGEQVGYSVGNAGDMNGDGLNDFLIGSITASSGAGEVYVIYGKSAAGPISNLDLSTLTTQGFRILGANASDQLGYAVAGAGDINGDGLDDIVISAPNNDDKAFNAGAAYVIYGQRLAGDRPDINIASLGANGFKISGQNAGDNLGVSVARAGDVNADGLDDLIVGSTLNATGGTQAGSAYVIFGQSGGGDPSDVDLSNLGTRGFQIIGNPSGIGDLLGISVSAAGDVNADGIDDLVVGAYGSNVGGGNQGAAYIIYGSSNIAQQFTTLVGTDPWFF